MVFGLAFALVIAELCIRRFKPQISYALTNIQTFPCLVEGTYRWIRLQPNKACTLKSAWGAFPDTEVKTNSLGLRNPEISPDKPTNIKRILFIGDSFTMGWGVPEEASFPKFTETILNQVHVQPKAEAVNAGVLATGPSSYYVYLKHFGLALKPDIVVVGLYMGNDIYEQTYSEWIETDDLGLPDIVQSKRYYVDSTGNLRLQQVPIEYSIPLVRDSQLFVLLMKTFRPQVISNIANHDQPYIRLDYCQYIATCTRLDDQKAHVQKLLLGMKKRTEQAGARFLVVMIPAEFQVRMGMEPKYGIPFALTPEQKQYPNKQLAEFFTAQGIDYLDLIPQFMSYDTIQTYYTLDDHWNAYGHAVTAAAIAEKLVPYFTTQ